MPIMTREPRDTETATADRDWFGGRRWTGIAAVAVIIVLAVCVVILVIHRGDTGQGSRGQGPATPGDRWGTTPTVSRPSLITTVPTTAPPGTTWSIFETVALPTIPGQGPGNVTAAGIATGYAHTPTGALAAAANASYRYLLAGDASWQLAANAMLAPGTGNTAWIKARSRTSFGSSPGAASTGQLTQIAGYQFVSYSASDGVIQIATRDSDGTLQVGTDHVVWSGTDWLLALAPSGAPSANTQQVDSLDGFIEWHGV